MIEHNYAKPTNITFKDYLGTPIREPKSNFIMRNVSFLFIGLFIGGIAIISNFATSSTNQKINHIIAESAAPVIIEPEKFDILNRYSSNIIPSLVVTPSTKEDFVKSTMYYIFLNKSNLVMTDPTNNEQVIFIKNRFTPQAYKQLRLFPTYHDYFKHLDKIPNSTIGVPINAPSEYLEIGQPVEISNAIINGRTYFTYEINVKATSDKPYNIKMEVTSYLDEKVGYFVVSGVSYVGNWTE